MRENGKGGEGEGLLKAVLQFEEEEALSRLSIGINEEPGSRF